MTEINAQGIDTMHAKSYHLLIAGSAFSMMFLSPARAGIIAVYDFDAGGSGEDFDQAGNDSADGDLTTTASRLTTGGPQGLDGGGANNIFNTAHPGSDSAPPLANWGNGNNAEGDANYAQFTITPEPLTSVTYDSLSLFHGSFNGTGEIKVTYAIGAGPEVVALAPTANTAANADPLTKVDSDFADFTTTDVVTWRVYAFNTDAPNTGTRIDDITINGTTKLIPEPSSLALLGLCGLLVSRRRR